MASLPGRCDWVGVVRVQALLLLEMATILPGRCGRVGGWMWWDGGSGQNYMLLSGDLSPLYEPLLVSLSGDGGLELIKHPCAHWVVKKLIVSGGGRRREEIRTNVSMVLEGVASLQSLDWNGGME